MEEHQSAMRIVSEEIYLYYVVLIHIGNWDSKLKVDLQNDFTTGNNLYPKSGPQTLHLLDKYSKIAATIMPESKG